MRKQERLMAAACGNHRQGRNRERRRACVKNFRRTQIHGTGATVRVSDRTGASRDENAAVEQRGGGCALPRRREFGAS